MPLQSYFNILCLFSQLFSHSLQIIHLYFRFSSHLVINYDRGYFMKYVLSRISQPDYKCKYSPLRRWLLFVLFLCVLVLCFACFFLLSCPRFQGDKFNTFFLMFELFSRNQNEIPINMKKK